MSDLLFTARHDKRYYLASAQVSLSFNPFALLRASRLCGVSSVCPVRNSASVELLCIPYHKARTMLPTNKGTTTRVQKALHDSVESIIRLIDKREWSHYYSNFQFDLTQEHNRTGAFDRCEDFDTILDKLSNDDTLHERNRDLLAALRSKKTSLKSGPPHFVAQTDQEALKPLLESIIARLSREARTPTHFKTLLQDEHERVRAFACCEEFPEVVARLSKDSMVRDWASELLQDFHKQLSTFRMEDSVTRGDLMSKWFVEETYSKELDAKYHLEIRSKRMYRSLASWVQDARFILH